MLRIRGLVAGYEDGGCVLESIDLQVAAGESVALMGRNGMGKTTLLRAVMGLLRPVAGGVTFDGRISPAGPPSRSATRGSPTCRRAARSSRTSPWRRTCGWGC